MPQTSVESTTITLDHPVAIRKAVSVIMKQCGGNGFGFGFAWEETPKGRVPFFSVHKKEFVRSLGPRPGELQEVSSRLYCVNPHVVCDDYKGVKSDTFTIYQGANLCSETEEELRIKLSRLE